MIKLLRVDERLIHGQVAVVWTKQLGVNRIVVADDVVIHNDMQMMALKMAVPNDVKASIVSVDKAIGILNDPRAEALKILVIAGSPQVAVKICNEVKGIPEINVGNYGRMEETKGVDTKSKERLEMNLYVDEQDKEAFKELLTYGVSVHYQPVPGDKAKDVATML